MTTWLGEDIAEGGETLITEQAYEACKELEGLRFEKRSSEEVPFSFYRASAAEES